MGITISGGATMSGGMTFRGVTVSTLNFDVGSISNTQSYVTNIRNHYDTLTSGGSRPDFYTSKYKKVRPDGGITDIFYHSGIKRFYGVLFYGIDSYTWNGTTSNYSIGSILARDGWGDNSDIQLSSTLKNQIVTSTFWSQHIAYAGSGAQVISMPGDSAGAQGLLNNPNAPVEGYKCVFLESRFRFSSTSYISFNETPYTPYTASDIFDEEYGNVNTFKLSRS